MQKWAVEIVGNSRLYPMHSESVNYLDGKLLAARVEWHSWSTKGQHGLGGDPNAKISGTFRGATLYEVVDPDVYGTYLYNKQTTTAVSGGPMAIRPTPAPAKRNPHTVTEHATALVQLAAKPIRWGLHTTGSLVKWAGNTIQNVGSKL